MEAAECRCRLADVGRAIPDRRKRAAAGAHAGQAGAGRARVAEGGPGAAEGRIGPARVQADAPDALQGAGLEVEGCAERTAGPAVACGVLPLVGAFRILGYSPKL